MRHEAVKELRPLLALLVLVLAARVGFAAGASAADSSRPINPVLHAQPDGSTLVEAPGYLALIGADGNLHSFRVADVEMLDDQVGVSLGAFFHAGGPGGPRKLETISTLNPTTIEATDGTYTAQYRFHRQEVRIVLTNNGVASVPYFVVLSPRITIAANLRTGEAAAAPSTESWGDVRFSAANGAYIELTGGTRIWGPWLLRQVWEVSRLGPGQQIQIRLKAGVGEPPKATLEQLVGARVKVAAPNALVHMDNPIELEVAVENRSETPLASRLSMELSACRNDQVIYASSPLQLPPKQVATATFKAQVEAPDFYRARVTVSAEGRSLTTARAGVGYRVAEIVPKVSRPADFRDFWQALAAEVGEVAAAYRLDLAQEPSGKEVTVWVARYPSVATKTIHGWYLCPQSPGPHPAILFLSGYGARPIEPPVALARHGYVVLAIDVRGNPVDRPRPHPFEDYSTIGIESPQTYVYREIVGHALRAVQFLSTRAEVDPGNIGIVGVSEGGGVGLLLGALSPQVKAVAADAPLLCDFALSLRAASWPYSEIARYLQRNPAQTDQVRRTLAYFDLVNFAPEIRCPVLLSAGFLDPVALPAAVYGVFNLISAPKEMRPLPEAGHEGGGEDLWGYKLSWLARHLGRAP
jgi:cephalosporin-C deacetylase